MKITKEDVNYVAKLSLLKLDEKEEDSYTQQLNDILDYVEKLNELDTSQVKPTAHVLPVKNVFREDKASERLTTEEVLANAPDKEGTLFKVPRVIE